MKNTSMTALFLISLLAGSPALADRPADIDNTGDTLSPPPLDEPSRPADLEPPAPPPMAEEPPAASEPADTSASTTTETKTSGDVLQTPVTDEPVKHLDFPRRGMSKEQVEAKLGKPEEIESPVGQPPITRWVYNDRIVYFEYSSVIHAVAR